MPAADRRVDRGLVLGSGLRTLADGLDHPEGVCWSPAERRLYADGEGGQLYRFGLDGGEPDVVTTIAGAFLVGLAMDGDGAVYACDVNGACVWRIAPEGSAARYADGIAYPNYPAFAADGRLFVSDSGDWDEPTGTIVAIHPGGRTERVETRPLAFANGIAVRDDAVYVAESAAPAVVRIPLAGGEAETVCELEGAIPDGIAFDADGGLWISCWQPNRILRLDPDGTLDTIVDDWSGIHVLTPTNVAFAGDDLDVLAIASLAGWSVRAIDPGVRGMALAYPRL